VLRDGDRLAGLVCLEAAVTPQEEASEALNQLTGRDVNQVPVIQDGRLVGMRQRRDVLRWLQLHGERAA
jgi:predicted transcriptional regulator